jgi:hypothetical protein
VYQRTSPSAVSCIEASVPGRVKGRSVLLTDPPPDLDLSLVVHGGAADVVVGLEQRLAQQRAHMPAPQSIHDPLPLTLACNKAGEPKLGQVLIRYRRSATRDGSKGGHVQLGVAQRPQHLHPRRVGEQDERRHRRDDGVVNLF